MSRIILVGPTCSGKNYLREKLVQKGFTHDVSYTTREPRPGEVDGVDYHFISKEDFEIKIDGGFFYEWVEYNNSYYGTGLDEWKTRDVFIMEPNGVQHISEEDRKNCFIIFLQPTDHIRHMRMAQRGWDSGRRLERAKFDEKRFKDFKDYDLIITNSEF